MSILLAFSSFAFAEETVDLNGSLNKSKVISSKVDGNSIIADYPDNVTLQVDKRTNKIQSVRYTKRGFLYKAIEVGNEWNFQRTTGHSDFSYNRGGMSFHYYTEKDGTATVYETEDGRVIAITRIADHYAKTAYKYHNGRQLGIIK